MKQQSASQFQRVNSRRLWTGIGFLVILLLLVLMLCSYMLVILARGGGSDLITHYQLVGECASSRMMPLAAAVDRY